MKDRWKQITVLLSLALTLGVVATTAARRYLSPSVITGTAATPSVQTPSQTPDEPLPQIRSSALSLDFTALAQIEAQQHIAATRQGFVIAENQQSGLMILSPVTVTLEQPEPFLALSAAWASQSSDDAKLTVSIRGSADGSEWGEWQQSSLDGDPRTHTGLFFLPTETRLIQCRIEMERDQRGASPVISGIQFRFISPGATPRWMRNRMLNQPRFESSAPAGRFKTAGAGGLFPRPGIVSRLAWGCPDGDRQHRGEPSYTTVTHLIVHHTATGNEASDWAAVVRSIWNFHVFTNGWSDVGYNYLIDPDGLIYQGRAGGDNVLGAHFSCANSGTMGTALLGTFTSVAPATTAQSSLEYLLAWKCDQRAIDPAGVTYHPSTQLSLPNIAGHRDANGSPAPAACAGTECPGNALYPLLPVIRSSVRNLTDPADDFSLETQASAISLQAGTAGELVFNSATVKGNAQSIRLEVSGLPAGVTASLNPPVITSGGSATLRLTASANAVGGVYPVAVTATGTTIRARQFSLSVTGTIANVSAASYQTDRLAREAIVAAFGAGLAAALQSAVTQPLPTTLAGVTVSIKDSAGTERDAPLFFVSPSQINYQIPPGTAAGAATVTVTSNGAAVARGTMNIADYAPALFSASSDGSGVAAALALRVRADNSQTYEPVAQYDDTLKKFVAVPIDLTEGQVFLILFGTGIRYRPDQDAVKVKTGGLAAPVFYAGEQGAYAGLDQINVLLPAALNGRGVVDVEMSIGSQTANVVQVKVK